MTDTLQTSTVFLLGANTNLGKPHKAPPAYSFHVLPGIPNPQFDEGSIAEINTMTERKQLREGQDRRGLHFRIRASSRSQWGPGQEEPGGGD